MVKVRKNIVSKSVASKVTYNGRNPVNYIVIHETDNTRRGANADAHGRLQANGNSRQASWHYTVDDKEAVQSFNDRAQCWHAGNRKYNQQSIGIEICVNFDGNFKKAVDNAVELTKRLMRKYNVPASRVIQHNQASGKNCPRNLRSGAKGVTWSQFKAKLSGKTSTKSAKKTSSKTSKKSSKSISQMAQEVIAGKHGNGHANRRKSLGISKTKYDKVRKKVNEMAGGSKSRGKSINQMASEVIRGEHGSGHARRRKSLGVNRSTYRKVRAEVNRRLK